MLLNCKCKKKTKISKTIIKTKISKTIIKTKISQKYGSMILMSQNAEMFKKKNHVKKNLKK